MLTQHRLKRMRQEHGDLHPATFAAYGRAFIAWGGSIKPPESFNTVAGPLRIALASAYTVAQLRATGSAGHDNKAERKHQARKAVQP